MIKEFSGKNSTEIIRTCLALISQVFNGNKARPETCPTLTLKPHLLTCCDMHSHM